MLLKLAFVILALLLCALLGAAEGQAGVQRECVLDKVAHVQPELVDVPAVPPLCGQLPGVKTRRIAVNGARLYVEEEGQGLPIVLLHGGPESTHQYFHPACARLAQFARVIYYDRRGCGESSYTPGADGYTVDEAVNDLEGLRKALKIDRWVVLGHSFGGFLAQCYAVKYPDHLAGLILVGAQPPFSIEEQLQPSRQGLFITPEERQRIHAIWETPGISLAKRVYNSWLNGDWKRQNFYKPTGDEMARIAQYRIDEGYGNHLCYCQALYHLDGAFTHCPLPTLLMEGEWDLTWNTDKPAKMQQLLPKAQMITFARSAHAPFDDEPEQFTRAVREFVSHLPSVPHTELTQWKRALRTMKLYAQPAEFLTANDDCLKKCRGLADQYSASWLATPHDPFDLIFTASGLYSAKRYTDALAVYSAIKPEQDAYVCALVWRGHLLDLLHRRSEALACYRQALQLYPDGYSWQMGQYYIVIDRQWIASRLNKPFKVGMRNMPL